MTLKVHIDSIDSSYDCVYADVDNENENEPSSPAEEWDLMSPLLLQSNHNTTSSQHSSLIHSGNNQEVEEDYGQFHTVVQDEGEDGREGGDEGGVEGEEGVEGREEEVFVSDLESKEYCRTLLATTFTMIFIILVSGSYFFEWSDTVLRVQVDTMLAEEDDAGSGYKYETGEKLSVDMPLYTDATFQSTLGIFQSSHSNIIVFLIIVSSIVAPVLYMIIQPIIIFVTCSIFTSSSPPLATNEFGHRKRCKNFLFSLKRVGQSLSILEFFMKFSMALIFVNSILNICTSKVKFILGGDYGPTTDYGNDDNHFNNGDAINVFVVNNARGGLISYLVGLSFFGIAALLVIRKHYDTTSQRLYHLSVQQHHDGMFRHISSNDDAILLALNNGSGTIQPPPSAFHKHQDYFHDCSHSVLSHEDSLLGVSSMDDDGFHNSDAISKRILNEDVSTMPPHPDGRTSEEHMTPLLSSDNDAQQAEVGDNMGVEHEQSQNENSWPSILDILQFESGLLSFILLFPISTLPLIRLEYTGLLTTFLDTNTLESTTLSLSEIAQSIISTNNYGRDIFGFVSITSFWINVIIIPIITWIFSACIWFSVCIWRKESEAVSIVLTKIYNALKIFQPFAFMSPFAISLFVTVSSLQQVTDFLFNQNNTCQMIQNTLGLDESGGSECMIIKGHLLPGSFVLLIQAICTDIFMVLFASRVT